MEARIGRNLLGRGFLGRISATQQVSCLIVIEKMHL
jgi:hypothetical protein